MLLVKVDDLKALEQAIILGPTNTTAYYILKYLQKGNIKDAQLEYQHDGDKLGVYRGKVAKILGCRLHLTHDCNKPFCKDR